MLKRDDLADVLAGRSYSGGAAAAATAAQISEVSLFSPAANNKNLVVTAIWGWAGVASSAAELKDHNASVGALAATPGNRLMGGAAGVGQVRTRNAASGLGTAFARLELDTRIALIAKGPFIVPPGRSLVLGLTPVNVGLVAWFEWLELDA